jgi:hypothetical protein
MFERRFPGILREFLHDLDEYHLAKVLLGASGWAMRAHQFGHQRVEAPDQFAGRLVILAQRRSHQLPRDSNISHV